MDILIASLSVLGTVVFVLVLFLGALLVLLGFPGTFLIVLDALVYSAVRGWKLPWWLLLTLLGIAVVAEISDNLLSAVGTKQYGGSDKGMGWAMAGGLLGAVVGGLALGPLLPVVGAIVGPIAGGLAGGFAGGYWYERRQGRPVEEARKAGVGAVVGRVAGMVLKSVLAVVMITIVLINAF